MANENGQLMTWVLYSHPEDMPQHAYVARKWLDDQPTLETFGSNNLWALRIGIMQEFPGMIRLAPAAGDDPHIIETWV